MNETRRKAYEQAIEILRGRPGFLDSLTPEQLRAIAEYDGPESIGVWPEKRGKN